MRESHILALARIHYESWDPLGKYSVVWMLRQSQQSTLDLYSCRKLGYLQSE